MKKRSIKLNLLILVVIIVFSCNKEDTIELAVVQTNLASNITSNSAICGGNIISDGGAPVTTRGICWDVDSLPTIDDNHTIDGVGIGEFNSTILGIEPGRTYYVRAYATNNVGVSYGNQIIINSMALQPTLYSTELSSVTSISTKCSGYIISDGGAPIIAKGVCWGLKENPTIEGNKTNEGSGAGIFISSISNLIPETVYYVRTYATNSVGTTYGRCISFIPLKTTLNNNITFNSNLTYGTITDYDGNVYKTITIGNQTWMAENLKVTHYRNGDPISKVTDVSSVLNPNNGAYSDYYNTVEISNVHGKLYNWYSINDSRKLAPNGWHIPSDSEWTLLKNTLGSNINVKIREVGFQHWFTDNYNPLPTNESGFTAIPGGMLDLVSGQFGGIGSYADWWSSSEFDSGEAWSYAGHSMKKQFISIRCIKD